MILFHNAKSATFAIFVFSHIGGDDFTGQLTCCDIPSTLNVVIHFNMFQAAVAAKATDLCSSGTLR